MADWNAAANEIFLTALSICEPDQRLQYLQLTCAADETLDQQVRSLLRAHELSGKFLARGWTAAGSGECVTTDDADVVENDRTNADLEYAILPEYFRPGSRFAGNFEIRRIIGCGGMGVVALAQQLAPIRREVAVKIVRPESASTGMIARFERERMSLARLTHPGIGRILEAGYVNAASGALVVVSDSSAESPRMALRPFLVMEYVAGEPITAFCQTQQLGLNDRLKLVAAICRAAQHAHNQGIIHRDLKPSNIIVERCDGRPVPRIIDFGIARMRDFDSDECRPTSDGSLVGTLEYMSPEQAAMSSEVDSRADVYSIGAILYELLTGDIPYSQSRLRGTGLKEALRVITEDVPERPSARIAGLRNGTMPEFSDSLRGIQPETGSTCHQHFSRDLDWVVMKALAKDLDLRYQSAGDMADDLQRFVDCRPVLARPPSVLYRFSKVMQRNQVLAASSLVLLFLVAIGVAGSITGYRRITQAETGEDESNRVAMLANSQLAGATRDHAQSENELASAKNRLIQRLRIRGNTESAARMAEDALVRHLSSRDPDPHVTRELMLSLARNHLSANQFDYAVELLQPLFDEQPFDSNQELALYVAIGRSLVRGYAGKKQYSLIFPILEKTIVLLSDRCGPLHERTLSHRILMGDYLNESEHFFEAIEVYNHLLTDLANLKTISNSETVRCLIDLGNCYYATNQWNESILMLTMAMMEAQPDASMQLEILPTLIRALIANDDLAQAEEVARSTVESFQSRSNVTHWEHQLAKLSLAGVLLVRQEFSQAESLLREVLSILHEDMQGRRTLSRLHMMLGTSLTGQLQLDEAEFYLRMGIIGLETYSNPLNDLHMAQLQDANAAWSQLLRMQNSSEGDRSQGAIRRTDR